MATWLENKIEGYDDPGAPTTPTRALDTPFQPSASKHVLGMYTLALDCDNDETVTVELRSDAVNPPTTVRASAHLAPSDPGAATPKVVTRQQLVYVVPPGHYVSLAVPPGHYVSLAKSGTGDASIAHQTEMVIS